MTLSRLQNTMVRPLQSNHGSINLSGRSTYLRAATFSLNINPMTLKLEGDLDILKMNLHTENEVARLRHSKRLTVDEMYVK